MHAIYIKLNLKASAQQKKPTTKQPTEGEEIFANNTFDKGWYLKYLRSYTTQQHAHTLPRKTHRWPTETRKDAQLHWLQGQCKSEQRWDCHFISVRRVIIKKTRNNKCWKWWGEKGTCVHYWWGCQLVQPLRKTVWTVWRFLKKLMIEPPYDPLIPLLDMYQKTFENSYP